MASVGYSVRGASLATLFVDIHREIEWKRCGCVRKINAGKFSVSYLAKLVPTQVCFLKID